MKKHLSSAGNYLGRKEVTDEVALHINQGISKSMLKYRIQILSLQDELIIERSVATLSFGVDQRNGRVYSLRIEYNTEFDQCRQDILTLNQYLQQPVKVRVFAIPDSAPQAQHLLQEIVLQPVSVFVEGNPFGPGIYMTFEDYVQ